VSVGPLRARFIDHFSPFVRDAVIAGADRDDVTALVFPELAACRSLCGDLPADATPAAIVADARVERQFATLLAKLAAISPGSSTRVCRIVLMAEPPSIDAGEMTDKGSINQRAVLNRRAALVEELYRQPPSREIISIEPSS
jgi:feruloyl-CoA synthase